MNFSKYTNKLLLSASSSVFDCPTASCDQRFNTLPLVNQGIFCQDCGIYISAIRKNIRQEQNAQYAAYQEESRVLRNQFRLDALQSVGLYGHPKANKAFDLAMESGDGELQAVYNRLADFAELLK